jgi:lipoprotein-anchoring transpeptidase ErfK/SrfK
MAKIKKSKSIFNYVFSLSAVFLGIMSIWLISKKVTASSCCSQPIFKNDFEYSEVKGEYYKKEVEVPFWVFEDNFDSKKLSVLGVSSEEKWIEVDLSEQKLWAWEGNTLYLETLVSTGLPWWPTPQGEFRIWAKTRATKMEGGEGKYYYNLPNVPFVMFFENEKIPGYRGYGLHGTYWHNDFGKVHSHGCVNLPTPIAEKLYYWTSPQLAEGKFYVKSSVENPGTKVVIHE